MATTKQRNAARDNIRKAQKTWKGMSSRQRSLSQPEGRSRQKPGTTGEGRFFRIVLRPKEQFVSFRMDDVGDRGHVERLAGRRSSGSWATQAWLISKKDAHVENDKLVPDSSDAKNILKTLGSKPEYVHGNTFKAKDRQNIPEDEKPTKAQQKARSENIRKAQDARL